MVKVTNNVTKNTDPSVSYVFGEVKDYTVNLSMPILGTNVQDDHQSSKIQSTSSEIELESKATQDEFSPRIAISPNPASNLLNVEIDSETALNSQIIIYSELGQVVYEKTIDAPNQHQLIIPVEDFEDGLYFVSVKQSNQVPILRKFIKL